MRSKPFYWMGALALIALLLYSCQKDEISETLPTTPENPTTVHEEPEMEITVGEIPNDGTQVDLPIGIKEVKEIMKVKMLLKDVFKETFLQLLINHDFNPLFPHIETREPCNCPGFGPGGTDLIDCSMVGSNIPSQTTTTAGSVTTVHLSYRDTDCNPIDLAFGGGGANRTIEGNIDIDLTGTFLDDDHVISIRPRDNFKIDGYQLMANNIEIEYNSGGGPVSIYQFNEISGLQVTHPSGAVTTINSNTLTPITDMDPSTGSSLLIFDSGVQHGATALGFGLLDDQFVVDILPADALSVQCGDETVKLYTQEDSPLIYDMSCSCIGGGRVNIIEENLDADGNEVLINTVYYDYDGGATLPSVGTAGVCPSCPAPPMFPSPPVCDEHIVVETYNCDDRSLQDPNSAVVRTGNSTFESIDCL